MRKIRASCHVTCEFSVYSCFLRCAALCYFIVCLDPLTLDLQRHWARLQDGVLLQASWSWAMLFWICRGLPCQLLRVIGPPFPPSSSAALHPERVLEGPSFRHGRNISVSRSSHGALQLSLTLHCGCCWSCDQCRRSFLWPWFCLDALLEMTRTCRSCFVLLLSNSAVVQSCWHSVTRRPLNLLFLSLSFVSAIYSLWSLLSDFPSKIKILFTRMTLTTTCSAHFLLFHFKTGRWYFGVCVLVTCGESSILQKNSSCWFPAPCFYLWTLLQQFCMIYSW